MLVERAQEAPTGDLRAHNRLLVNLLCEGLEDVGDARLHFDDVFEDDLLPVILVLFVDEARRAILIVICLLQFIPLASNVHFVASRLIGVIVLSQGLDFVDALGAGTSTCIGHVLHSTFPHNLRAVIILASYRLLDRVFTVKLCRSGLVEVLILDRNRGRLWWHEFHLRLHHLVLIALLLDVASFTSDIVEAVTCGCYPHAWHIVVG